MSNRNGPAMATALFVPGSRPERFAKALASGAGRVIVDFEDAVEEPLKQQARHNLAEFLRGHCQARVMVRINAPDHAEHHADIDFCARHPGVIGVILPKTESADQVEALSVCAKPVWPLIETATGLLALEHIAGGSGVERLSFGGLDLALDLGIKGSEGGTTIIDHARYQLVVHSAAAGLAAPVDTVFPDISDLDGLSHAARRARGMGFDGLLCIHPAQVAVVQKVFAPVREELEWARKVLAAAEGKGGAFRLDGQMIDAPVLQHARQVLAHERS